MSFQNITLANLQALVAARLQNPLFFSQAEVNYALNQAIRDFQLGTAFWVGRFVMPTLAAKPIYNIGTTPAFQVNGVTQLLMPLRMSFNGLPIDPCSLDDLDNGYPGLPGWQLTTTATPGAPTQPILWSPVGISYFAIYPADAAGNNSLQVDGVLRAPVLVNQGDFINIDSSNVPPLVSEAICTLSTKRGGVAFQKAQAGHAEFMRMCAAMNSHIKAVAQFREYMAIDRARQTRRRYTTEPVGIGGR